ncbi:3' exoribonuclease family, domain 1 [Dictyocaulus viviparus]|uniref:Ribosomal RNA-processing protein 42 n=1 Tax=Dictyocaulus viviparus TaxID=29172 RepID=A0A0D8XB58_DICVI|nr:3' exoribonuclease family, domain 1 [Dictyocaulus viviparus]
MVPVLLGVAEKHFIAQGFADGCRSDGRNIDDFRPVWIESPVLDTTHGSARVKIDSTDVLVGVKCEVVECADTSLVPNRLQFTVDPSCIAAARVNAKGGERFTKAIASLLNEAYHGDGDGLPQTLCTLLNEAYHGDGDVITNMERLILSKHLMWKVYVDVLILLYGGNIVDAIFIAVKSALLETRITELRLLAQDADKCSIQCEESTETNFFRLEVANAPLSITVSQIGKSIAVDCSEIEEALTRTSLWVVVDQPENDRIADDQVRLRAIRQMGPGGIDPRSIPAMIELAIRVGRKLHTEVDARLQEIFDSGNSQFRGLSFFVG